MWGYEWIIKESSSKTGPGPNRFSPLSIVPDRDGNDLEITIIQQKKRWYSGEIYSEHFFRYGDFALNFSLPDHWDSNIVFGFFLYNNNLPPNFNEIDFEISRWGSPEGDLFHFSVQPYEPPGQTYSFLQKMRKGRYSVHILWKPESVAFRLFNESGALLDEWEYNGPYVPKNTESRVHLNLWLFQGSDPAGDGELKIQIHDFTYTPFF